MPAHRKGKEVRKIVAIRLEPSEKELLVEKFGGVQAGVDHLLESLKGSKKATRKALPKTK